MLISIDFIIIILILEPLYESVLIVLHKDNFISALILHYTILRILNIYLFIFFIIS